MIPRAFLSLILVLANVPLVFTQQPAPPLPQKPATQTQNPPEIDSQDVVRITANLVQVDAVVTKDGKQVADLTADDFELFEDGKLQTITNFSYISNVNDATAAPPKPSAKDKAATPVPPAVARPQDVRRTVALVVDDLGMSFQSVADAQRNLRKFVNEQLGPNDLVAIIHTSGEVGALQQFTTDRRMLGNAIDRLRWYPCSRAGLHVFAPVSTMQPPAESISLCGGMGNMKDTLQALKFIVDGMRELPGRKSLVLMSDLLPIETQDPATSIVTPGEVLADVRTDYTAQLKKVAEKAIRSSVVIYTVDTRGLVYTGLTAADPLFTPGALASARPPASTMRQVINNQSSTMNARSSALNSGRDGADLIARQTGGFLVQNSNDFGLKRIAEDQNGYYLLAYRPEEQTFNKQFHHLKLTVKRKGLEVRTRNGFLGTGDTEKPQPTATDQLAKALISPFGANDINVRLTTMFTSVETGSLLRSLLYIDAKDLVFLDEPDGGHVAAFDLGMILFGENGRVVDQQKRAVKVQLNKDRYQNALQSGLVYTLETPIKQAGAFQYRVALRDQASSRIGSAGQFLQIPNLANGQTVLSGLVLQKDVPETSAAAGSQSAREAISAGPAVRQFHQGDTLLFAFLTFNAQQHVAAHLPLASQTRIFRDGKMVFSSTPSAIDAAHGDPRRIPSVGRLQLGPEFTPGEYVLQIVISDPSAKEKRPLASQWIDFEVVK